MTNEELRARVEVLTAQNSQLRAALEAFANEENWAPSEEEPGFWIFGNDEGIPIHDAPCDKVKLVLAETPGESLEAVRAEAVAELQQALESDRINVIEGVNRLTKEIESRAWLATGARSSYEWDDARYQQEFRDAAEAILEALEPLKKIGADLSNCPADAKRSLERMRAEAGRDRAVRELEALMEQLKEEGLTFESQSAGLAGFGHSVAASAIGLCRVKIGRRLEEIAKERP